MIKSIPIKAILLCTLVAFVLLTTLTVEVYTRHATIVYGYPRPFLFQEQSGLVNTYEAYVFKTRNFLFDWGLALAMGTGICLSYRWIKMRL